MATKKNTAAKRTTKTGRAASGKAPPRKTGGGTTARKPVRRAAPARRRTSRGKRGGRAWLKPAVAVLALVLLAGAGWLVYERMGTGPATVAALAAADQARESRTATPAAAAAPQARSEPAAKAVQPPAPTPTPAAPAVATPQPAAAPVPAAAVPPPTAATAPDPQLALRPPATAPAPVPSPGKPAWQANAVPVAIPPGKPLIAIVLDDIGPAKAAALQAIALPGPITLAFLPYAEDLPALTRKARAAGHELLVHMPMEPANVERNNPGPNALLTSLSLEEIRRRTRWGLQRFEGFVGINNHMGSEFTTFAPGLAVVMEELKAGGYLFLDSRTSGGSLAEQMARSAGVPTTGRDVFLDNDDRRSAIAAQLAQAEAIARKRGVAVAIGHPYSATLAELADWIPKAQAAGFVLVPISALVSGGDAQAARGATAK